MLAVLLACSGQSPAAPIEAQRIEIPDRSSIGPSIAVPDIAALADNNHPISAVGVVLDDDPGAGLTPLCTATLVGCDVALTADHCLYNGTTGAPLPVTRLSVFFPNAGHFQVVHAEPRSRSDLDHDVAALYLRTAVPLQSADVSLGPHRAGGTGKIVGFGKGISDTPLGLRRAAAVTYRPCDGGTQICWDYMRDGAGPLEGTTCAGDSGGPLFDDGGRQIGVHARGTSGECGANDHATDIDLATMASTIGTWLSGHRSCPPYPAITWAVAAAGQRQFLLDVPAGYTTLRAGLGTEFRAGVRATLTISAPSRQVLCSDHGGHAFAFCSVLLRERGDYTFLPQGMPENDMYQLSLWLQ